MICNAEKKDYLELIEIWEESVRATHDFLPSEEISQLKILILEKYFDAVELTYFKQEDNIIGFSGVADNKLEMLFISSNAQGQGVGSKLCQYAIKYQSMITVDVNEQNPRALEFYKKMGFTVVGRSELDAQGRPYPLLHMELIKKH